MITRYLDPEGSTLRLQIFKYPVGYGLWSS